MKTNPLVSNAHYLLLLLFLVSTHSFSQNWNSGWVYIENVKTGLVMDVQGDVKANGTTVWPFSLNHGRAQLFRFSSTNIPDSFGDDARYMMAYDNSGLSSDFYVSVKTPPLVVLGTEVNVPPSSGASSPDLLVSPTSEMVATDDRMVSDKKTFKNFVFSIESKRAFDNAPTNVINDLSITSVEAPKQLWRLIPVAGQADTYFIQSAHFTDKRVVEPVDFNSGGTLVLSSFTGNDIQKWRIIKTKPKAATNLTLSNFEWEEKYVQKPWYKPWRWHFVQKIKGTLSWTNSNTSDLTKQYILIDGGSSSEYDPIALASNKTSHTFNIKSTTSAKTKEHCFKVRGHSKWVAQNVTFSDGECQKPTFDETPPATPIPAVGISKLVVTNCHSNKKSVRLWTLDHTVNDGVWKDHGTLNSQWQGSGCPVGSPKVINLSDNHSYTFVAIDCGNAPPTQTQGSCHKFTTSQIKGDTDGTSLPIDI
ncbi:RICIN domain-containing protein [Aquimarina intermedia]|uniref:Ricin-type beta-trefoil lectin protein n=1 Tax=Aquimarina intermedia TaxID=350814 RepID=A0A5S5CBB1_9FLAO|nr:RICIN domain-containing protein [Aquimarina intermedia]TYP75283.1 hypothetical protein BD809_103347 [Aquimarina intermedia]